MKGNKIICDICGKVIEEAIETEIAENGRIYGIGCNNPDPLNYTVCCNECNAGIVMPIRNAISSARQLIEYDSKEKVQLYFKEE